MSVFFYLALFVPLLIYWLKLGLAKTILLFNLFLCNKLLNINDISDY